MKTKVYKLNTLDNSVIAEYESMNECARNEEKDYSTIWNQCNTSITGNGGFINTPYYFSKYKDGIPHDIIIAETISTGEQQKYYNVLSANLETNISRSTIIRHLQGKHTTKNFCGIKFYKKEV